MTTNVIPLVKAQGSPYERGFQHGSQCGDLIRRSVSALLETIAQEASWLALDGHVGAFRRETALRRAQAFLPQMTAYAPHLVEEIRGIADGARVPFAEALFINVRSEVAVGGGDGCTSFALGRGAAADGRTLIGMNLDHNPLSKGLLILLHIEPDAGPAMLMCTFAGLVGFPGINSAGLAMFQNALATRTSRPEGVPHYLFKRSLLERTSIEESLDLYRRTRVCRAGNHIFADRNGILDLEVTPAGFARLEPQADVLGHTNHFLSAEFAAQDALLPGMPDSLSRLSRLHTLINGQCGRLTLDAMKAALSDHEGHPVSICRHEGNLVTAASMIAEPDQGRLHVAAGNPCENAYVTYSL